MYTIHWGTGKPFHFVRPPRVSRTVWLLGFTSMFTDISSEMITSVLPAYLVLHLGISPLGFGAVDGLQQGVGSIVRWIGGAASDRWRRHKEVAAFGYAISAACRLALLLVGNAATAIGAVLALDRAGKGLRTAPRDALLSLSSTPATLGASFGVHRMLDAMGALLGPVVAFLLLLMQPRAFDAIFVVSFSISLVGLAIIVLFVENASMPAGETAEHRGPSPLAATRAVLANRRFRQALLPACGLALATISDAFVYLTLQRASGFQAAAFPMFAVVTAAVYLHLAIPAGRMADRVGRGRVFLIGHVLLVVLYGILWTATPGVVAAAICLFLLGSYYAMTDGVIAAAASAVIPAESRATGLAVLAAGVSLCRLFASVAFGALWTYWGLAGAILVFTAAMAVGLIVSGRWLFRLEDQPA